MKLPFYSCTYWCFLFLVSNLCISAEKITVLTNPVPFFSEVQQDGTAAGYSIDYIQQLTRSAGFTADVKTLSLNELLQQLDSADATIATGIARTPDREDDYFWIAPLTANVIGIYSNQLPGYENLDYLETPISLAVVKGDYRSSLLSDKHKVQIVEVDSWQQGLQMLLSDKVDSIFFSELGVAAVCAKAKLDCSSIKRVYTHDLQLSYVVMPKTEANRQMATRLSNAVQPFVKSKAFSEISGRWQKQLKPLSESVKVIEGIISMGSFDRATSGMPSLWVLTHIEPLFSYRDDKGNLTGYSVELVRNILLEAGLQTEILSAPWQRLLVESELKSDVLVFNLARTKEREDKYHWLTPITKNTYSLYALTDNKTDIKALEDIPKRSRIAVLSGDFRQELITQVGSIPIPRKDWEGAMSALFNDEADYLFFSDAGVTHFCGELGQKCEQLERVYVYDVITTYLALSKIGTEHSIVDKLKKSALRYKATEEYQEFVDEWLGIIAEQTSMKIHEHQGVLRLWSKNRALPLKK